MTTGSERVMANEGEVKISIRRDAAQYLLMLLEDHLLDMAGDGKNQHLEIIRNAYQHVRTEIEQSLKRT